MKKCLILLLALVLLVIGGCETLPNNECADDSTPIFTVAPTDLDKIAGIITLGNLNPPGHTFPTDHIYFFPTREENADRPNTVNVYSPGDLTITQIWASEHVKAGFADYNIFLTPCDEISIEFFHITTPSEEIFGDTADFSGWHLDNDYSTGGEIYRTWSKEYDIEVAAGEFLGTAGGNPNQWAFDLGVYDERQYPAVVAAPERWEGYRYLNSVCPLSLYEPGPLLDRMVSLVERDKVEGEGLPCGYVLQDVPGTAHGCWFLEGIEETYPEDLHLALVRDNIHPAYIAVSTGNSVRGLRSRAYKFLPESSGLLNRDFAGITPDGQVYGYVSLDYNGVIIISMPDIETLYIELLPEATQDSETWAFTGNKTVFKR